MEQFTTTELQIIIDLLPRNGVDILELCAKLEAEINARGDA